MTKKNLLFVSIFLFLSTSLQSQTWVTWNDVNKTTTVTGTATVAGQLVTATMTATTNTNAAGT